MPDSRIDCVERLARGSRALERTPVRELALIAPDVVF
jgi:hypothetical protein